MTSYSKGKFDHEPPTEGLSKEFEFKAVSELVYFNNSLQTLDVVVKKQIQEDPRTSIAFHKLVAQPTAEDPAAWKVSIADKKVFYKIMPSEQRTKHTQQQMASLLAPTDWDGHVSRTVWMLRWAGLKGFLPVKPAVVTLQDIVLEAGNSILL